MCKTSHVRGVLLRDLAVLLQLLTVNDLYRFLHQLRRILPPNLLLLAEAERYSLPHVLEHVDGVLTYSRECPLHGGILAADQLQMLHHEAQLRAEFLWLDARHSDSLLTPPQIRAYARFLSMTRAVGWQASGPAFTDAGAVSALPTKRVGVFSALDVFRTADMSAVIRFLATSPEAPGSSAKRGTTPAAVVNLARALGLPDYVQLDEGRDRGGADNTPQKPRPGGSGSVPWGPITLDQSVLVRVEVTPRLSFALFAHAQLSIYAEACSISHVRALLSRRTAELLHLDLLLPVQPPQQR